MSGHHTIVVLMIAPGGPHARDATRASPQETIDSPSTVKAERQLVGGEEKRAIGPLRQPTTGGYSVTLASG